MIAVVALVLGIGVYFGLPKVSGRKPAPAVAPLSRANAGAPRVLGNFARLSGTPFLMAPIHSGGDGGYSSLGSFSSGKRSTVHNYVFLDVTDQSIRKLIPTNDYDILGTIELPDGADGGSAVVTRNGDRNDVRWLYFEIVKQDTDRDGDLDEKDLRTIAVSDAGGRGYTELIGAVENTFGHALRDPDTLVVIYQSGGTKRVSVIDLFRRTVTSTAAVPDLGADVK